MEFELQLYYSKDLNCYGIKIKTTNFLVYSPNLLCAYQTFFFLTIWKHYSSDTQKQEIARESKKSGPCGSTGVHHCVIYFSINAFNDDLQKVGTIFICVLFEAVSGKMRQ